jgi:tight adherence protein B
MIGNDLLQIAVIVMAALAVVGLVVALFYPMLTAGRADDRLKELISSPSGSSAQRRSASNSSRDGRRRQVQDALKQIERKSSQRRKKLTLRMMLDQSGLDLTIRNFWLISTGVGILLTFVPFLFGVPWYMAVLCGFVGFMGLPRWLLGVIRKRRLEKFLSDLPDAIDIMVRGLRSGLPMSDAMKVIASESPAPIGPEFWEVVEGQRIGLSIEQGMERMSDRVPLQEVNFLSIVLNVQSKTGGNLTETLSNLSKVLRDRRKMKGRVRAASQEAKSSAAIIGALPFLIMGVLTFLNPSYLDPLFSTTVGNIILWVSAAWMLTGVLVMRQMINFDI